MGRLYRVQVKLGGQHGEVNHHIANLFFNVFPGGGIHRATRLAVHPLKDLHQFCRLDTEGHDQILGGVKLLPISFPDEVCELGLEFFHVIFLCRGICL